MINAIGLTIMIAMIIFMGGLLVYFRSKTSKNVKVKIEEIPPLIHYIPSLFMTLGVLGTFIGISFGLFFFDVNNIDTSIKDLLVGLKTAFITSIFGILFSVITKFRYQKFLRDLKKNNKETQSNDELALLKEISNHLSTLNGSLVSDNEHSVSAQLAKLCNLQSETNASQEKQNETLGLIQKDLHDDDSKLLTQLSKLESLQTDNNTSLERQNETLDLIQKDLNDGDSSLLTQLSKIEELQSKTNTSQEKQNETLELIQKDLNDGDTSLLSKLSKIEELQSETNASQEKQNETLGLIQKDLHDDDSKLLTQLSKLESLQTDNNTSQNKQNENITSIKEQIIENGQLLSSKFDEFGELLQKNNTEALVEVMKKTTEQFNAQMNELIQRLVKENFEELNNSVNRLNVWQKENKEMIATLTEQFRSVSDELQVSSTTLKEVSQNTSQLTNENSHLTNLIKELQKVMIDDTKFNEIVSKLEQAIDTTKKNIDEFGNTTQKLNAWIQKERSFKDTTAVLIDRLHEIEKIKDINGEFWNKTRTQMEEGVGIIKSASVQMRNDLDKIYEEFEGMLISTFENLDELIKRLLAKHK